jgi:hypothetical protein
MSPFTKEEAQFLEQNEAEMRKAKTNQQLYQVAQAQLNMAQEQQDKSIIKEQLDLSDELDTIEHLLRGHILVWKEDGSRLWEEPEDKRLQILTDYGVYFIMNFIMFYINKNTLLSNYDEEVINQKMLDLSNTLNDAVFMQYDEMFMYPSFEECKQVFMKRIEKKTELRKFAYEIMGQEIDEVEIKKGFLKEVEERIDYEMQKISEQLMKNKLKRFESIIRVIQDTIHSTYNRAYKGQERSSLRKHHHISENVNPPTMPQRPSKINPLNWGR